MLIQFCLEQVSTLGSNPINYTLPLASGFHLRLLNKLSTWFQLNIFTYILNKGADQPRPLKITSEPLQKN